MTGDEGPSYTVDDALVAVGFGNFQILVLVYAGVGWVSEAMEMMLLSFVGPAVQAAWSLSAHEESLITSVVFVGMLIGAYSWGVVSDRYGRRQIVMPNLGWRWLLALSSLPTSFLLLFYKVTPESPRYLCLKGRKAEAIEVLEKIARVNGRELPSGNLVSDHEIELQQIDNPSEDARLLSPRTNEIKHPSGMDSNLGGISSLSVLLSPKLARSTVLLWAVFFGNAFSYYGLVLLTTELNGHSKCMSHKLQTEKSQDVGYKSVFIASFAEIPGLLLSAVAVDKLGRKLSMSTMFFMCCIFLLPLVFHLPEGLTTGLLFLARICITATFTIVYIYAPEMYPTSVRTTGVGIASSVGRIGGMICPLVAVGLVHECHQTAAILLFEIIILFSGICVMFLPIETMGQELRDSVQV
ncbi:organic cation/carnitine transporter 7 isoform X2 [Vigna unguiculata]|uniref:organic cation/carnitine transporter 7 isoform X2 n=1 Tax=Vigna unguiculata TaxID=3917 RepID=UPI0010163120|nr:organic cation/carnitine transporter 7 isoform X2 [Vigna unguiculata]